MPYSCGPEMPGDDHLEPTLRRKILESREKPDVDLDTLRAGAVVTIETKNTVYRAVKQEDGSFMMEGSARFCPTPTKVWIHGSTFGGSMIAMGKLQVGNFMEFSISGRRNENGMPEVATTSAIRRVTVAEREE